MTTATDHEQGQEQERPGSSQPQPLRPPRAPKSPLQRPLGRAGRAAVALFTLHALLLFFPPLPPDVKGSLWSYVLGYLAVILAGIEIRAHATALTGSVARRTAPRRAAAGWGWAAAVLAGGLAIRWHAPELFERWSREEGVWEPLTLITFLAAAFLLFAAARLATSRGHQRRHLQLLGAGFILLVLEEIDYLGIFGGMIGRVDGVYVGSPHDLIGLAAKGLLPLWAIALLAGAATLAVTLLLRSGLLQPARLAQALFARRGLWLVAYGVAIAMAQVEDISLFFLLGEPRIEELLELTGAIFLLAFAADLAAESAYTAEHTRDPHTVDVPPGVAGSATQDPGPSSDRAPARNGSTPRDVTGIGAQEPARRR